MSAIAAASSGTARRMRNTLPLKVDLRWSRDPLQLRSVADTVQVRESPQDQIIAKDGRGRVEAAVQGIVGEQLVFGLGRDNGNTAILTEKINPAIGIKGG